MVMVRLLTFLLAVSSFVGAIPTSDPGRLRAKRMMETGLAEDSMRVTLDGGPMQEQRFSPNFDRQLSQQQHDTFEPQQKVNTTASARIRAALFQDYDPMAYPFEFVWEQQRQNASAHGVNVEEDFLRTGFEVGMGIVLEKVFGVSVQRASADLVVWF